ncbi:sensor histidine kinase [Nocardiopsis coralliicola]
MGEDTPEDPPQAGPAARPDLRSRALRAALRAALWTVLWAVLCALAAWDLVQVRNYENVRPALIAAEAAATAAAMAAAFALRRRQPFAALALATVPGAGQAAAVGAGVVTGVAPTVLLPGALLAVAAGRRSDRVLPVAAIAAAAAAVPLAAAVVRWVGAGDLRSALTGAVDWSGVVLALAGLLIAPWLAGRYWRRQSAVLAGGWTLAERLERTRARDAEHARLRERARIASGMHDSLGHDLALIGVRAAALEATADGPARAEAAELRAAAHQATLHLRDTIGLLRSDGPEEPPEGAAAAVARAHEAGMRVRLVREGPDPDPDSGAGRLLHRTVQEALTNAARHAPGAEVTVHIRSGAPARGTAPAGVEVEVADSGGAAAGPRESGSGSGLPALRRRIAAAGGEVTAGPSGQGFALRARIPEDAEDPDGADGDGGAGPDGDTDAARRLRTARSAARRRLGAAVAVPCGIAAVVLALSFGLLAAVSAATVLPPEDYARLEVGAGERGVRESLPVFDFDPGPLQRETPPPPGASCRYYLAEHGSGVIPVYRLCFDGGVLVAKDRFDRA